MNAPGAACADPHSPGTAAVLERPAMASAEIGCATHWPSTQRSIVLTTILPSTWFWPWPCCSNCSRTSPLVRVGTEAGAPAPFGLLLWLGCWLYS